MHYPALLVFQACAWLHFVAFHLFHLSLLVSGPLPLPLPLPGPLPAPLPAPGDGNWWISEAINTSQSFHVIDGLQPGAVYSVRLLAKGLLDNASIFEDVIQTRVKGERSEEGRKPLAVAVPPHLTSSHLRGFGLLFLALAEGRS